MKMNVLGNGYFSVTQKEFKTNFKAGEYEIVKNDEEADVVLRFAGFYKGMIA